MSALAIVVALCVPIAMSLRSGDERSSLQPDTSTLAVGSNSAPTDSTAASQVATDPASADGAVTDPAVVQQAASAEVAVTETAAPATPPAAAATAPSNVVAQTPVAAPPVIEALAVPSTELICAKDYDVVAGDYWILIAKKVSVSLDEVLAANKATTETAIYPGRTVCLPSNASAPKTAQPTTTDAPSTAPATTAPATTVKAPTTTVKAPSTSTPAAALPRTSYNRAEVEAIIRQVWPDDLGDEAVRIATRESDLKPGASNFCCFGLFQIYYNVHKSWLAQMGITSAEQLYDPMTNSQAAYAMYLRSGWGPWRL